MSRDRLQPSPDSVNREASIAEVITEIRTTCVGIPGSPRAEALTDIALFLGLSQAIGVDVVALQRGITGRKERTGEYVEAWGRLDTLLGNTVRGFGRGESHFEGMKELSQSIDELVAQLYPPQSSS
jgi:hypothetical protein